MQRQTVTDPHLGASQHSAHGSIANRRLRSRSLIRLEYSGKVASPRRAGLPVGYDKLAHAIRSARPGLQAPLRSVGRC